MLPSLEATAAAAACDAESDSEEAPLPPSQRTSLQASAALAAAQPGRQPAPLPLPYDGWVQGSPLSTPLPAALLPPELLGPGQLVQLADGLAHLGLLPGAEWMRRHRCAASVGKGYELRYGIWACVHVRSHGRGTVFAF